MTDADDIASLTTAVNRLADKVDKEKQARWIAIAVGVAAVIVLLVCLGLLWRRNVDDDHYRAGARVAACKQSNDQQQRSIDANEKQVRVVFGSLTADDELTPAEKAQLDALYESHDDAIEAAFPMRRCDAAGIAAFYDDDPNTNPYVEAK